jgi:ribonuclease-3
MALAFFQRLFRTTQVSGNISFIQETFDIKVGNSLLFDKAFTHRSAALERDNERLELLGDAVLDLCVAHHLHDRYPHLKEGALTKLKSKLVSRERVQTLAIEMGLAQHLELVKQKDLDPELIIGNVFEAIWGAMYLDQGFECTKERVIRILTAKMDTDALLEDLLDAKSKLLELAQKERLDIRIHVSEQPRTSPYRFKAEVKLESDLVGVGHGNSKKKAEKEASIEALRVLEKA